MPPLTSKDGKARHRQPDHFTGSVAMVQPGVRPTRKINRPPTENTVNLTVNNSVIAQVRKSQIQKNVAAPSQWRPLRVIPGVAMVME